MVITVDLAKGAIEYHATNHEPWRVTLVDTGAETMTGGRLKRVAKYLEPNEPFFLTYSDGVADLNVEQRDVDVLTASGARAVTQGTEDGDGGVELAALGGAEPEPGRPTGRRRGAPQARWKYAQ